jgi:hypothetical protein
MRLVASPLRRALTWLALALSLCACGDASPAPRTAAEAYIWGYPLVVTIRTLETFARLIPTNRLTWQTALSGPDSRLVVAPNRDTLYAVAPMDLRGEPYALTVPEISDRYYGFELIGAYTDVFGYVGTRATGGRAGTWVITPPGWSGSLPAATTRIESPTPQFFLLGRFLVDGDADVANVLALRDRVRLEPLSSLTGTPPAPAPPPFAAPAGTPQDIASAGVGLFDELGDDLAVDPPSDPVQQRILAGFASLGIGPGRHPSLEQADPAAQAALAAGVADGDREIAAASDSRRGEVNGWRVNVHLGRYGDDALLRAVTARIGWGANVAEEAIYALSQHDADGAPYTGGHSYVLHFPPGGLPPVDAFWSLTLYGPDRFFVANSIGRYAIGDRTPGLVQNPDGSLDVYLQHSPPAGHESNWLPAPEGEFLLILRLYLPRSQVIDGSYVYPAVRAVS